MNSREATMSGSTTDQGSSAPMTPTRLCPTADEIRVRHGQGASFGQPEGERLERLPV